ncbi:MAG: hypothetical protein NT150_00450 [Bacteroidetes bacterium]|nr:hypothetical protein [Bacteroidota bacterium]
MKSLVIVFFSFCLVLASCAAPEDSCQKINKTSECLKYNNCNILENWKLNKIVKEFTTQQKTYTKQQLYKDLLLVYNDGTMEFRIDNVLSPLNKWEFASCQELKLFSSKSDTTLSIKISKMEANQMIWQYNTAAPDTVTVNSVYFSRL